MSLQEKLNNIENEDISQLINLPNLLFQHSLNKNKGIDFYKRFSLKGIKEEIRNPSKNLLFWSLNGFDIFVRENYGIILTFDGLPQVISTFRILGSNELYLTQLKGINQATRAKNNSDPEGLRYIDCVPVMILAVKEYAKKTGFSRFTIQSSANREGDKLDYGLAWKLYKIFDEIPYNLGFNEKENHDSYIDL